MTPKMVDCSGKKLKIGYLVALTVNTKNRPFKIIRRTKKGNIVVKRNSTEIVVSPDIVTKLRVEELI